MNNTSLASFELTNTPSTSNNINYTILRTSSSNKNSNEYTFKYSFLNMGTDCDPTCSTCDIDGSCITCSPFSANPYYCNCQIGRIIEHK